MTSGKTLLIFLFYAGFITHSTALRSSVTAANVTAILDNMINMDKYDKRLRPNYNGGPVDIKIGFWMISIDPIDVVNMDYTIDFFLRQEWVDPRLDHHLNETIHLGDKIIDNIWTPGTYFVNAKTSTLHHVTNLNVMVILAPRGLVKHNIRVTVKAACSLDLRHFPIDKQTCPLVLESYGYHKGHIVYRWENVSDGMSFIPENVRLMPQYQINKVQLSKEVHPYVVGNFSALRVNFLFVRSYSYFLSHIYGTSSIIVVISWMAFILPRDQTAARVSVGVTSLLTEVTVIDMLNSAMPKVSYVKSIDKYLITCLFYVFLSLAEYCLVLILDKRFKKILKQKKKEKDGEDFEKQIQKEFKKANWWATNSCTPVDMETRCRTFKPDSSLKNHHNRKSLHRTSEDKSLDWICSESLIEFVDTAALVVFPVSFAAFNLWYWLADFQEKDKNI